MSDTPKVHPAARPAPEKPKDCLSCRLTGAATFTGVGIYALRQAQLQGTFQRVRPKGGSIVGGQVTAVIGIGSVGTDPGRKRGKGY